MTSKFEATYAEAYVWVCASYKKLAEIIHHCFSAPKQTPREVFLRIVFNVRPRTTRQRPFEFHAQRCIDP